MDKRYLAVLALVIVILIAVYGMYLRSSSEERGEAGISDVTPPTTSSPQNGSSSSGEIANDTNQSSISIPLEKPPFIE